MSDPAGFASAISGALKGDATTIGTNTQQSDKERAIIIARDIIHRYRASDGDMMLLASQLLRALNLPE